MNKKIWILIVISLTMLVGCTNSKDQENEGNEGVDETSEIVKNAEDFISLLAEAQYEEATQYFDETLKKESTPEALKEEWDTLNEQVGELVRQEYSTTTELNGYQVVMINGFFEDTVVMFNISFDDQEKIAGYYVQ